MQVEECDEYILGTDALELERLRFQHQVWVRAAYELFERAQLGAGQTVLDLGCGPGFTTFELAHVVGPSGRVIARDISARFIATLRHECARLHLRHVEPSLGPVEELALDDGSLDAAYARWLFCWLADPAPALERVARALKPGGVLLLQEYVDWGALRMFPHGPAFARAVQAALASWKAGGATIDFAARAPELAPRFGFALEHFAPRARIGRVGSLEWRWIDTFFRIYLPKVVERGLLTQQEFEAWLSEWEQRAAAGATWVQTPTVADVILRRR
ncbi:MAG: methyltransferase domain-containing protein [Planctomycetes bacterium]|nr:methyltransferase domain-containing protein [Planctomycetota bacterium]